MILDKNGKEVTCSDGVWSTPQIGNGTKIWHPELVNLYGNYTIGENCNIGAFVEIGPSVSIGTGVTIGAFCFIPAGVTIMDWCFIGPRTIFCNDKYPPSSCWGKVLVAEGARIGAGSVILPGVIIGRKALVGAGSVVTKDVAAFSVVKGNPAR